jgi:Heterokaryon incompatibility protein (HET)
MKAGFFITKSNVGEMLVAGSLAGKIESLPQSIQDAVQCAAELGEKYLWVDALCIIQDDEEHKRFQISQMDRVYGSATLTLVCAPPDPKLGLDTYDGLPGFRVAGRLSEQDKEYDQGLELLTTFLSVSMAVSGSRWSSHAWTFQEDRLSRRKLFFRRRNFTFSVLVTHSVKTLLVKELRLMHSSIHRPIYGMLGGYARLNGNPKNAS